MLALYVGYALKVYHAVKPLDGRVNLEQIRLEAYTDNNEYEP